MQSISNASVGFCEINIYAGKPENENFSINDITISILAKYDKIWKPLWLLENPENTTKANISHMSVCININTNDNSFFIILTYDDLNVKKCVFYLNSYSPNYEEKLVTRLNNQYIEDHIFQKNNQYYCLENIDKNSNIIPVNIDWNNKELLIDEENRIKLDTHIIYPDVIYNTNKADDFFAVYAKYGEINEYGYCRMRDNYTTTSLSKFNDASIIDMDIFNALRIGDIIYHIKENKIYELKAR